MESNHPLLASAGGGLDQSSTTRQRHHSGYVGDGRLIAAGAASFLAVTVTAPVFVYHYRPQSGRREES
jgi:hypothetical protein